MIDKTYWQKVVDKLLDQKEASWAAHVVAANIDILDDILNVIDKETLIKNCLVCYSIDFSAQTDLDTILSQFSVYELIRAYKNLEKKPLETAGALMWLLEDLDADFFTTLKARES